jgi:hypothetical protein
MPVHVNIPFQMSIHTHFSANWTKMFPKQINTQLPIDTTTFI